MADGAVRFGRMRRLSVTNVAETSELDFQLGHQEAAEIFSATLIFEQLVDTPANAFDQDGLIVSLHRETESLESALDLEVDEVVVDSEIIAQWGIQIATQDEAGTAGGSAYGVIWNAPKTWVYRDIAGSPLLTRRNLTGRFITTDSNLVANGIEIVVVYRIIEPTNAQLLALATERR